MNKEAPIGAEFDLTISLIITEGVGTNWCLFILTVMRDTVVSKSAPTGADLDMTYLRSTVRMNKEAPIGADSFCDLERYCLSKSAPVGASLFIL